MQEEMKKMIREKIENIDYSLEDMDNELSSIKNQIDCLAKDIDSLNELHTEAVNTLLKLQELIEDL